MYPAMLSQSVWYNHMIQRIVRQMYCEYYTLDSYTNRFKIRLQTVTLNFTKTKEDVFKTLIQ